MKLLVIEDEKKIANLLEVRLAVSVLEEVGRREEDARGGDIRAEFSERVFRIPDISDFFHYRHDGNGFSQ